MKKFVLSVLCALVSVSAFAQGTIQLSNIGKGTVDLLAADGSVIGPAGNTASVSFALEDGTLIGTPANVLGAGFFSAGSQALDGLTGEVTLRIAAWDASHSNQTGLSDPFTVTLGGAGVPPSPAAAIPADFSGVGIPGIPEPSTIALAVLGGAALLFRRRK